MRVQSFADPPEGLFDYPRWRIVGSGRVASGPPDIRAPVESRLQGRGWLVRLEGVETREAAEVLTGAMIEIERSLLPKLGRREHYQSDLVGCRVTNLEGIELGTVTHFVDAPAHPVMAVGGVRERLVPATPVHLRAVDVEARSILVDWPEDF
jgi:16S rRNA processing protein RimM